MFSTLNQDVTIMRTGYLLGPIALAAATLAAPAPIVHADDGDKAYCLALTHRAVRTNAQAGKWLDRVTRHDGVTVTCDDKRIEFRRFSAVAPDRMGDGWEDRQEREWNASQCKDARSRQAIEKGWTIRAVYTTAAGRNVSFDAECD
jgi:hypothetical protein